MTSEQLQQLQLEFNNAGVAIQLQASFEDLLEKLTAYINHLLLYDMHRLLSLLYRLDVPEDKLRYHLQQQTGEQAAELISRLIIERQLQKIEARKAFTPKDDIPDEERW